MSSTLHFYIDGAIPVGLWLSKKGYDYYQAKSDLNKSSEKVERKGITENGLKKSELNAENVKTSKDDAETKTTSDETQRKGWDGTVKGNASSLNAQQNMERESDFEKIDKSALITATGNLEDFKNSFVDLEKLIGKDKRQSISSNKIPLHINNVRNRINQLENSLKNLVLLGKTAPAMSDLDSKLNEMDRDFFILLKNLDLLGEQYNSISNVLKTKHDTAKNSVGNIR